MSKLTSGKNNPNYGNTSSKSARWKSDIEYRHGYRFIRNLNHPFADSRGFVREHRLVAEQCLLNKDNSVTINGKIYLSPDYVVHHLDFDKLNNNPNNLFICENSFHSKFHNYIKKFRKNNPNTELSKEELIQMFFTYKDIAAQKGGCCLEYLTVKEIATELRISLSKAYEIVADKGFPKVKIGKTIRIPKNDFYNYMNRNLYKEI